MSKILTAEKLINSKQGTVAVAKVFSGDAELNTKATDVKVLAEASSVRKGAWNGSAEQHALRNELREEIAKAKNAAAGPSSTELASILAKLYIDVQRIGDDMTDYSSAICQVITRADLQETTMLRDILPFTGKEKVISGQNDSVPLMESNLANAYSVTLTMRAFGYKNSLKDLLFNPFSSMIRVAEAAARINVDAKNNDVIGAIVGTSFSGSAAQQQAADTTSGATYDVLIYNTIRKALKKLAVLKDPLSKKAWGDSIAYAGGVKLLCHPADAWELDRVVSGQLAGAGGIVQIGSALPIAQIIPYGGGLQNGLTWGKETLSFPGVTQGKCYLFIPDVGKVLNKRELTMESGTGSTLQLSTEERAWYRVTGTYLDWLLGKAGGGTTGEGAIVEITLPTDA